MTFLVNIYDARCVQLIAHLEGEMNPALVDLQTCTALNRRHNRHFYTVKYEEKWQTML